MSVTSDSDPVEQDDNSTDALLDSPKATAPLMQKKDNNDSKSITTSNQRHGTHVLIRQKASYKNSLDI